MDIVADRVHAEIPVRLFRLIGYDYDETKRNSGERTVTSINYLTGKVKTSKGTIQEDALRDEWRPLKGKRKICLEDIGDGLEFQPEQEP